MSALHFGFGEKREYYPELDNINWHEVYTRNHPDAEDTPVWGEAFDELGEFCEQLHQENMFFWLNETNPDFDTLIVRDHRDENGDWWFSRGQLGEEFQDLFDKVGSEATIIKTKYPVTQVAQYILKQMSIDVDSIEGVPEDWR